MKPVVFAIPLASNTDAALWAALNQNLSYTLRSILRQTDPNFSVLIACHDRPVCDEMFDPRVEYIPVRGERATRPDQFIADKSRKRRALADAVRERGPCYMVQHDSDDIVHRKLVEYFRRQDAPYGYTYPKGYVMDLQTGAVANVQAVWSKPFSHVCGSSAAMWLTASDFVGTEFEESYFRSFKQHALWPDTAAKAGRPLVPVDFPCCIYVQNNSVNISALLQRSEERVAQILRVVERNAEPLTSEFVLDFSLDWIWEVREVGRRKVRKPDVPMQLPTEPQARLAAVQIDIQRLLLARMLSPVPASGAAQRRSGAEQLAKAVVDIVTALRPKTVVEIGAHEGTFSKTIKQLLPESRVVAFEANSDVHAIHTAAQEAAGVEYLQKCVSDREGQLVFNVPVKRSQTKSTMGSVLLDSYADEHIKHEVPAVTLDGFLADSLGPVALWIDVEGAVAQVLAGAEAVLSRCLAVFLELETTTRWPGQALAHEIMPRLAEAGLFPLLVDVQREWQFNVLFVRPDAIMDQSIVDAAMKYVAGAQT